jgi:hypothetical protein
MSILTRVIQLAAAVLCQNFLQENRLDAGRFKGFPGVMALFEGQSLSSRVILSSSLKRTIVEGDLADENGVEIIRKSRVGD